MEVRLPKLGEGVDSGVVVNVFVKEGDAIEKNQPLLELENEKAVAAIPSPAAGRIAHVHVKAGDKLTVGQRIVTLAAEGVATAGVAKAESAAPESEPQPEAGKPGASETTGGAAVAGEEAGVAEPSGRPPAASPSIRYLARELGIDLARIRGSERGGRIVMADLRSYVQRLQQLAARGGSGAAKTERPAPIDFAKWGPITIKPLSPLRQTISRRMAESWSTVPRVTQFDEADVTRLQELRQRYKAAYEQQGTRLTLTAFILKCVLGVLPKHPIFNCSLDSAGENVVFKAYYHIGIAVDTEAGLMVPVLRDADRKSLLDLSHELEAIARKARERKVAAEDLQGGTFTISNQGGLGGAHFTPIINAPQVAILGIGRGAVKPVWREGKVEPRTLAPLALSYDHRVIDGASAARFIVELTQAIENFAEANVSI